MSHSHGNPRFMSVQDLTHTLYPPPYVEAQTSQQTNKDYAPPLPLPPRASITIIHDPGRQHTHTPMKTRDRHPRSHGFTSRVFLACIAVRNRVETPPCPPLCCVMRWRETGVCDVEQAVGTACWDAMQAMCCACSCACVHAWMCSPGAAERRERIG